MARMTQELELTRGQMIRTLERNKEYEHQMGLFDEESRQ
jgi:hypothetical protein